MLLLLQDHFLQPPSPSSAPSPSPSSTGTCANGGKSIEANTVCVNQGIVEVIGCSFKITIPITDPTTPNMVTIRSTSGRPIPDNVQISSNYTYTVSPYEDAGIRLISNEAITGDRLVITLDVSSATNNVKIRGVALQTQDQSGATGRICGGMT